LRPAHRKKAYWDGADPESFPLVPCRPLSAVLALFGISHIDFWVLDMEGAEFEAVKTFDFSTVSVDVLVVELDKGNRSKDESVRKHLLDSGFEFFMRRVRNDWFVRKGFKPTPEVDSDEVTHSCRQVR